MNPLKESMSGVYASAELKNNTLRYVMDRADNSVKRTGYQRTFAAAVLAVILIAVAGGTGFRLYKNAILPAAYISVDINPSIELSLNQNHKVVSADACNEDGQTVLDSVELKGMSCEKAMDTLVSCDAMSEFLKADSDLTVTVLCSDDSLQQELCSEISGCSSVQNVCGEVLCATEDYREEAHDCDLSFGKYEAYLQLHECDGTISAEDCHDMTMAQIHEEIAAHHQQSGCDSESEVKTECDSEVKTTCNDSSHSSCEEHEEKCCD